MKDKELEIIKKLFIQLIQFLDKYGDSKIVNEYKVILQTIKIIESDMDFLDKGEWVIHNYKALFCSKGGLAEFNVWDDNFKRRKKINRSLNEIKTDLWHIMQKYI